MATSPSVTNTLSTLTVRVDNARDEMADLWTAIESQTSHLDVIKVDTAKLREELSHTKSQLDEARAMVRDVERTNADLRQELALVRQRLDDHLKRVELWDSRRWGFIIAIAVALFGASAAFTSGLIIASLRK